MAFVALNFQAYSLLLSFKQASFYSGSYISNTLTNGLHQMINNPIHILDTYSSCVDLIFKSQPNLFLEWRVHPALHSNAHY